MAGQKPAGSGGRPRGTGQGSASRPSASRQNQGRPRQGAANSAANSPAKANGARPATAKSRAAGTAGAKARSARSTGAAGGGAASQAASSASSGRAARGGRVSGGRLGAIAGPFRTVGAVPLATFFLSIYGLGASIYLTIAHYDASVTLVCSDKGLVNCAAVTTSAQSMVFGIFPVAVLGLAYYLFMTALNSPWVWRRQQTGSEQVSTILRYTRLGAVVAGMGFVLYLVYAELVQIGSICLWCTSVHVATFLIFTLIVFYASLSSGTRAPARRG
jgi:uncharacterized membrane protein